MFNQAMRPSIHLLADLNDLGVPRGYEGGKLIDVRLFVDYNTQSTKESERC